MDNDTIQDIVDALKKHNKNNISASEESKNYQKADRAISFYILTRRGIFRPSEFTNNQCKEYGWKEYHYQIAVVVDSHLDRDGFIIDHQRIDNMIQGMKLSGSCEQMHNSICSDLQQLLTGHDVNLYACKTIICPEEEISH